MSRNELYGFRDEAYSRWHRSIPLDLDFIDVDWQERCSVCHEPVLLYELKRDVGQSAASQNVFATKRLGERARIPTALVLYKVERGEVVQLRVTDLGPRERPEVVLSPEEWTQRLVKARCHEVQVSRETAPPPSRTRETGLVTRRPELPTMKFCSACRSLHPPGTSCDWPASA